MKHLLELTASEAKAHFLKGASYFNLDLPGYLSFSPLLAAVDAVLGGDTYHAHASTRPAQVDGVNYLLIANKDGRLAWRPYELMHPVLYVTLVDLLCSERSWALLVERFRDYEGGLVTCCSRPVISTDRRSDVATQVRSWWVEVEQQSLTLSLEYSHLLHTDVSNCYGALLTDSIRVALRGGGHDEAENQHLTELGDRVVSVIEAGRRGQTTGIPQGTVLMDFIAELVLGSIDIDIDAALRAVRCTDLRILRYRDDYRVFAKNDRDAERALKVISDCLRGTGMRLGVAKTLRTDNVVVGSVKPDKLAGIELSDLDTTNAKSTQKQLLRLHAFGQRFPNSGALKRLLSDFHKKICAQASPTDDLIVQLAIATDIVRTSPSTFPAVAGILSHLISLAPSDQKKTLWSKVHGKLSEIPYNGYLEIWLQRVTSTRGVGLYFESEEAFCQLVAGERPTLWSNRWIGSEALLAAMDVRKIVVGEVADAEEVIRPEEVALFRERALRY